MAKLLPSPQEWQIMKEMAKAYANSGLSYKEYQGNPSKALAIMSIGYSMGMPPANAPILLHIMAGGKPAPKAEAMLGLCISKVPDMEIKITDDKGKCTVWMKRPGMIEYTSIFTMDDAKQANLLNQKGQMYEKYPANMIRSRAISNCCSVVAPDALAGLSYTPEELGAVVDAEGDIIEAPKDSQPPAKPETPAEPETPNKEDSKEIVGDMLDRIDKAKHVNEINNWYKKHKPEIEKLTPEHRKVIVDACASKKAEFETEKKVA